MSASSEGLGGPVKRTGDPGVLVVGDMCPDCGAELVALLDDPELGLAGSYDLTCTNCPQEWYVPAETTARTRIAAIRGVAQGRTGAVRVDGFLIDRITAGLLVAVYEALSREQRERFGIPPIDRLVELGWKHVRSA